MPLDVQSRTQHLCLTAIHLRDDGQASQLRAAQGSPARAGTSRRVLFARLLEGGAIGISLWCVLFSLQLLPGLTADTYGVVLFAIGGMIGDITRFRRALVVTLIMVTTVVLGVTQTSLSNLLAARWVREDRFASATVPAVIVLSASLNPNGTVSGEAADNLLQGLELIRAGRSGTLVTTTVEQRFPGGLVTSRTDQARILALFGVPVNWLRTEPGESTREEALRSAQLLVPLGIRRVALVAAPMHTRRACGAFEAVGFVVTCTPARARSPGGRDPAPWPTDRLRVFGEWVYEALATLKYQRAGWLKGQGRPESVQTPQRTGV